MRRNILFILALIFGLIAAGSAYMYLKNIHRVSLEEVKPLVLAKNSIPARSIIKADQLTVKEIPVQGYPQGGVQDIKSIAGSVALVDLKPDDPVLEAMVERQSVPEGNQTSVFVNTSNSRSYAVPDGKRAVSIPIAVVSGVGYAVKPGDYVDVLTTMDIKSSGEGSEVTVTALAAQDVLVLSVGKSISAIEDKADSKVAESKYYTLALSVPQALTVTMGSEKGSLRLLLRNPGNKEIRSDQFITPSVFLDPNLYQKYQ
jgi:Flp pilus assembly protein CpaB